MCKTLDEVKDALQQFVGDDISPRLWSALLSKGYPQKVLSGETNISILHDEYNYLFYSQTPTEQKRLRGLEKERIRGPKSAFRSVDEAISQLVAGRAKKDPALEEFRKRSLRGKLLSLESVESWIKRRARKEGTPTFYAEGVPLCRDFSFYGRPRSWVVQRMSNYKILCYGALVSNELQFRTLPTTKGGILEGLQEISERHAWMFYWGSAEATLFVLTDYVPQVQGVRVLNAQLRRRLILEVDPTVTPNELKERYAGIRKEILESYWPKAISEKHLNLALDSLDENLGATWSERRKHWNERTKKLHSDWTPYKTDEHFRKDVKEAKKRLQKILEFSFGTRIWIDESTRKGFRNGQYVPSLGSEEE